MLEITDAKFISDDGVVIIDFYADWCAPCKMFAPTFSAVSQKYEDITFCKVNVDNSPSIAVSHSVKSIPTIIVLKNGFEIARKVGVATENALIDMINKVK